MIAVATRAASRPHRRRGQDGAATTELVLVTPVLLLLVMLVIHFGVWYHAAHVATSAAQEGARAARLEGGTQAAGVARAEQFLASLGPEIVAGPRVRVQRDDERARVEITATALPVVPGLRLPIRAVSEGRVERFRSPVEEAP